MAFKNLFPCCTALMAVLLLSGCASSAGGGSELGPWDAFTYTRYEGAMIRRSEGEFKTLNQCLNWVTLRTKRNGGSYYCGFGCEEGSGKVIRCEKMMGYPI